MDKISRRIFLTRVAAVTTIGISPVWALSSPGGAAQIHPHMRDLRAGDLLWTRKPDICVPYSETVADTDAKRRWREMCKGLIKRATAMNDDLLLDAAKRLETMTEREFTALYLDGGKITQGAEYSGGVNLPVGHVAIVGETWQRRFYTVEATLPHTLSAIEMLKGCFRNGVKSSWLSSWIASHKNDLVWHGRPFPSFSDADRAKIPLQALNYVGRPYCLFTLNLADPRSFYCSKLIWLCVKKALGQPIDGNSEPRRGFWLSPKQILQSRHVKVLFSPTKYGCI